MSEPTWKAPEIEQFLEEMSGRSTAIRADKCINPPIGCGQPASEFKDALSKKEYAISGLCQKCQHERFQIIRI